MKNFQIVLFVLLLININVVLADTYVRGYEKQNGTYVEPHYQTSPNNTQLDNWSTKGNVNPYTGASGYKNPDNNQLNTSPNQNNSIGTDQPMAP